MARMARLYIPHTAQLVQVRGNNGSAVFFNEADYAQWQAIVRTIVPVYELDIHAYALVENAVYLLVSARNDKALGQFMQDLGRRYVRYVNSQYQRTGTLWEGRYRTGYIQDVPYVLHAYVWLDGMSEHSSRAQHLGHYAHSFLREHAQYWQLGNTPFARERAYADLVAAGLAPTIRQAIAGAAHSGWALGSDAFIADLQRRTERRVVKAAAGRPVGKAE